MEKQNQTTSSIVSGINRKTPLVFSAEERSK